LFDRLLRYLSAKPRQEVAAMPPAKTAKSDSDDQRRQKARENLNIVTDTVTGLNVRKSDNVIQGVSVAIGLVLGAGIGAFVMPQQRVTGALVGGIGGVLVGLFASGLFLMIYRLVRHVGGRHD
jgi:hypothetical protein